VPSSCRFAHARLAGRAGCQGITNLSERSFGHFVALRAFDFLHLILMKQYSESALKAQEYLKQVSQVVDAKLAEHIPSEQERPERLHQAMRYSMFAGGKRLRPALAMAAFEVFGGKGDTIFYATSALEMLHTFSLIHDDLPCMDDDDFRRGRPTAHRQFDEATAVLSGDALCILAFELLACTGNAETVRTLAHALGTSGMLGGQMVDIMSEGQAVTLDVVEYIHNNKTAALIEASLLIGAQLANAPEFKIKCIQEYGRAIGLAFQVVDDILDIESTTEELGKDVGSDIARGKATYPAILGLEASKEKALQLYEQALAELDKLDENTDILRCIAEFIITRVN
jgi:geranylgeranyl diphosphate synthase, type II